MRKQFPTACICLVNPQAEGIVHWTTTITDAWFETKWILRRFKKRNVGTFRFEVVVNVIISGVSRWKGEGQLKRNVERQNAVTFSTPKKRTIFRQLLWVFLHTNSFICWPFYALLDSSTLSQSFSAENVFIGGRQLLWTEIFWRVLILVHLSNFMVRKQMAKQK